MELRRFNQFVPCSRLLMWRLPGKRKHIIIQASHLQVTEAAHRCSILWQAAINIDNSSDVCSQGRLCCVCRVSVPVYWLLRKWLYAVWALRPPNAPLAYMCIEAEQADTVETRGLLRMRRTSVLVQA